MGETLLLIVIGFGGVIAHSLAKLQGLSKDAEVANMPFDWKEGYIKKDLFSIILSFLTVFLWLALFGEAAKRYPPIIDYTRFSFFAFGALGSYVVQLGLSRAKALLRKTIDQKTNDLDNLLNTENTEAMDEYVVTYENNSDRVVSPSGGIVTLAAYASSTSAVLNTTAKEFVYATVPSFSGITFIRTNNTTYFVGHVPRPK